MRRVLITGVFVLLLILGLGAQASAIEVCFSTSPFGNLHRLEFTQFGNFFNVIGRERVFADRATTGSAYVQSDGVTVRIGLLNVGNVAAGGTSDLIINAAVNIFSGSGPASAFRPLFGDSITFTFAVIPCTGPLGLESADGPDAAAR